MKLINQKKNWKIFKFNLMLQLCKLQFKFWINNDKD